MIHALPIRYTREGNLLHLLTRFIREENRVHHHLHTQADHLQVLHPVTDHIQDHPAIHTQGLRHHRHLQTEAIQLLQEAIQLRLIQEAAVNGHTLKVLHIADVPLLHTVEAHHTAVVLHHTAEADPHIQEVHHHHQVVVPDHRHQVVPHLEAEEIK